MATVPKLTKAQQDFVDGILAGVEQEAKAGLVVAASKPDLIKSLRATWRKSSEHVAEQLWRFVRLLSVASVIPIIDVIVRGSGHFDWVTLLMAIVPVFETTWRQVFPALGAAKVDSAPGVTIVPDQVQADQVAPDPVAPLDQVEPVADDPQVGDVAVDDAPDPAP
jgi:hypothetical protein